MSDVKTLERQLAAAKARDAKALTHCTQCNGAGFWSDSTYDRCGVDVKCERCHGTGFPKARIDKIITDAFAPFAQWSTTKDTEPKT